MSAKKFLMIAVTLALLAVPMLQTANAAPPTQDTGVPRTITVTGSGTAYGAPDVVQVGLGVDTSNADIQVAMNDASSRMNAVIQALKDGGVDAKDIRTESFNIYQDMSQAGPGAPQNAQPIYRVSTTVSVTVRQTDSVGDLLAAAVNAGANNVNYIQFGIEDQTALQSQARQLAVADARSRAEELAGLLGLTVGEPLQITEGVSTSTPLYGKGGGGVVYSAAVAPPISQGTLSVDMSVTITFAVSSAP
jgi:uncharacterized protein YggE